MRRGVNPEKFKGLKNQKKLHRVVVVSYIPNLEDNYYQGSLKVLEYCLNSLVKTINLKTTNITLINNCSTKEVSLLVNNYIKNGSIDKYVYYSENKGKVYAVLGEARSVYEPYITITDCDVLFFNGWEQAVFNIFLSHSKAGVVTPLPLQYGSFYKNISIFFDNFFLNKIKYDKIVADADVDLYIQGVNNTALIKKKGKFNWKEKQYYLKGKTNAIIGAAHFVATYKSSIFRNQYTFPIIKFKNGYEAEFIDRLADEKGLYRLSTEKSFAYHIGNKLDDFTINYTFKDVKPLDSSIFNFLIEKSKVKRVFIPFKVKKLVFKIIKKLFIK